MSNSDVKCFHNKDSNDCLLSGDNCLCDTSGDRDHDLRYAHQTEDRENIVRPETSTDHVRQVLRWARMRSDSQVKACGQSPITPDLYRIAFDDPIDPKVDDISDQCNREPHETHVNRILTDNCISGDNQVINEHKVMPTNIGIFGKIIDEQNVELLSDHNTEPTVCTIRVNQLSLAEEVAIAEAEAETEVNSKLSSDDRKSSAVSKSCVESNCDQIVTDCDKNVSSLVNSTSIKVDESRDVDCNSRRCLLDDSRSHQSHQSQVNHLTHCPNTSSTNAKGVALHRLCVNTTRNAIQMPDSSIPSIRDCCCLL